MMKNFNLAEKKERFLINEIITLSIDGSFRTRNQNAPVYIKNCKEAEKDKFKKYTRNYLLEIYNDCKISTNSTISEDKLIEIIKYFKVEATTKFSKILHNNTFRFGISQKMINLFLKYLWCLDLINEPPHCPFDGIIMEKLVENGVTDLTNWTILDSEKDYLKFVNGAKIVANKYSMTMACWELSSWNPNNTI